MESRLEIVTRWEVFIGTKNPRHKNYNYYALKNLIQKLAKQHLILQKTRSENLMNCRNIRSLCTLFVHSLLTTSCPFFIRHSSSKTRSTRSRFVSTDIVLLTFGTVSHVWISVCSRSTFLWKHQVITIWCGLKMCNHVTFLIDGNR